MAAKNILTYGTLSLHSSEILKFDYKRSFNIIEQPTTSGVVITQPGNLSSTDFVIDVLIRNDASLKFTSWTNKMAEKPLEAFTFLSRSWGNYYLTDIDINCDEFDAAGDILRMSMNLSFKSNINFN